MQKKMTDGTIQQELLSLLYRFIFNEILPQDLAL